MAIKVIINSASNVPTGANVKSSASIGIQMISDYESPVPFNYNLGVEVTDVGSQREAIRKALDAIAKLADEIRTGAQQAKDEHPIGG